MKVLTPCPKPAALAVALLIQLGCVDAARAQSVQAEPRISAYSLEERQAFSIPSQPLATALLRLSEQAGIQVMTAAADLGDRTSRAVSGRMTTREALDHLLRDTGLDYHPISETAVSIERAGAAAPRARAAPLQEGVPSSGEAGGSQGADRRPEEGADRNASSLSAASSASGDVRQMDAVVVVGSNVRGASGLSSPVIVFDEDEIARTGVATVQQFFEKLPQNFGSGANAGNNANAGVDRDVTVNYGRGSGINLRGLGTGTTLTLLNGRRIAASNQFQYVDVSLIPLSVVERIEVLTDGASAIYGSDAIGGVVNIMLRKDFDGYETRLRYGSVTAGGMDEYQASQTGGWSWEDGHALLSYEFLSQDNLKASDKEFSRNAPYQPYDLYPESKRHSLYGTFSQQLAPGLALELSGIYARRNVRSIRASAGDFDIGVPSTRQYDVSAGLTYDLPASWQVRLNGAAGNSHVESTGYRTTTAGVVTPSSVFRISSDSRYVDIAADGPVHRLPAGEIRVALGATYRDDSYRNEFTAGLTPQPTAHGSRRVASLYAESVIPLIGRANRRTGAERLETTLAARFDDYSDFGSTLNPKIGLAWEVAPGVLFRSTYGTSFRAPVFEDMIEQNAIAIVGNVPNPASPTGRTLLMFAQGGNANLEPENATTWTGGIELNPSFAPGLSAKLNYYRIKYTDRVDRGFPGAWPTLFAEDTAPYASIITMNPSLDLINQFKALGVNGAQYMLIAVGPYALLPGQDETDVEAILDNRLRNVASSFQAGIDFDVRYGFDVGETSVNLSLSGQHILENTLKVTSESPGAEILNRLYRPVDFKVRTGASVSRGAWAASAGFNYAGAYTDPANNADPRVDAWKTFDLDVRYAAPASVPAWLQDAAIALNVQNLFDRNPPFVVVLPSGSGFDPVNANPLGRFFSLTLTKSW